VIYLSQCVLFFLDYANLAELQRIFVQKLNLVMKTNFLAREDFLFSDFRYRFANRSLH
jgi:hypothetical protein